MAKKRKKGRAEHHALGGAGRWSGALQYDADKAPEATEWLALDELERIAAVERYHLSADPDFERKVRESIDRARGLPAGSREVPSPGGANSRWQRHQPFSRFPKNQGPWHGLCGAC